MKKSETYRNRIELIQGTLDMLVLQALVWEPMHGYGIAQIIRMKSDEMLQAETGSLYPALHRLERSQWVKSEWKLTEGRQRAKYYQITCESQNHLAADHERWQSMVRTIATVMTPQIDLPRASGGQS